MSFQRKFTWKQPGCQEYFDPVLQTQKHRKKLFHWSRGTQLTWQVVIITSEIFLQGNLEQLHERYWKESQILFIIMCSYAIEIQSTITFSCSKLCPGLFGVFLTSYPILWVTCFPSKEHCNHSLAATSYQLSPFYTFLHTKMHYTMLMTVSIVCAVSSCTHENILDCQSFMMQFVKHVRYFRKEMLCSLFLPLTCNQDKKTKVVIPCTALLLYSLSSISLIICLLFFWCQVVSWRFPKPLHNPGLLLCLLSLWLIPCKLRSAGIRKY